MHRIAAMLLIGSFLALGGGALNFAHNLQHVHENDAAVHSTAAHRHGGTPHETPGSDHHHHHEPSPADCFVHGLLQAPLLSVGYVPLLVCLGLFVAFLTLLAQRPAAVRLIDRLDCRGPPAIA
jgi:hypothetical protein